MRISDWSSDVCSSDLLGALGAGCRHVLRHLLLADAEAPVRDHPARIGDRRVGEGLTDDGDLHAAALEELVGLEGGLHPLVVEDVAGKQRELELLDDLVHALGAVGELTVRGDRKSTSLKSKRLNS